VLGCGESAANESFSSGLLEYPQYTRPREFEGLVVPEPLLNGNHREIEDWQFREALYITLKRRPEMAIRYLQGLKLTKSKKKLVDAVYARLNSETGEELSRETEPETVTAETEVIPPPAEDPCAETAAASGTEET
jgi:hypothetical protein